MNARSSGDLGLDQVPYWKELGLDYIELSVDRIMRLSDERFVAVQRQIAAGGLPVLCCNNFIPPEIRLVGAEFSRAAFENYIRAVMGRLGTLKVRKVVFGSAKARALPSYMGREEGMTQLTDRLKFIASAAEGAGIEVEIEHLNRIECNVINTFAESTALAKKLNRPNVKSIFDYYHFAVTGEDPALIKQNEEWIGHTHFACLMERHLPDIHDVGQLEGIFALLRDCAYDDTFSYEGYFPGFIIGDERYREPVARVKELLKK